MARHIVTRLPECKRHEFLGKSIVLGDRVRQDRRHPEVWLVSSSSTPNVWYRVHDGVSCGCAWHTQTGNACRHLVRVAWEVAQIRRQTEAQRQEGTA